MANLLVIFRHIHVYFIHAVEGAAEDFTVPGTFTVTFPVSTTPGTSCATVNIVNDNFLEGDHNFDVFISDPGPSAMTGTPSNTEVTINDDECKTKVSVMQFTITCHCKT